MSSDGIKPDPQNIEKILKWPIPENLTDLHAFLSLGNYHRIFVDHFSHRSRNLTNLTRKEIPFEWSKRCQCGFDKVKEKLTHVEVMGLPQDADGYILDTDPTWQRVSPSIW